MEKILNMMKPAVDILKQTEKIRLISHFDSDGITAASIITHALLRLGKNIHLSIVKRIEPELIETLKAEEPELIIFTDIGSGYLDLLQELNCKIIVLDHHQPKGNSDKIIQINPTLTGKGEDEISGAGVSYLFAKLLNERNEDLSPLAVVGAIGDMQDEKWEMKGINRQILEEAETSGLLIKEKGMRLFGRTSRPIFKALEYSTDPFIPGISGDGSSAIRFLSDLGIEIRKENGNWRTLNDLSKEEMQKLASAIICERIRNSYSDPEEIFGDVYSLQRFGEDLKDARELSTALNACGRMGEGTMGVLACMGDKTAEEKIMGIISGYRKLLGNYLRWVKENEEKIKKTEFAFYIPLEAGIHENFIGTITSIAHKSFFDKDAGFGMAETNDGRIKISGRMKDEMTQKGFNLKDLFDRAVKNFGGFGGGHAAAAGAMIPKEKAKEFISLTENWFKDK